MTGTMTVSFFFLQERHHTRPRLHSHDRMAAIRPRETDKSRNRCRISKSAFPDSSLGASSSRSLLFLPPSQPMVAGVSRSRCKHERFLINSAVKYSYTRSLCAIFIVRPTESGFGLQATEPDCFMLSLNRIRE